MKIRKTPVLIAVALGLLSAQYAVGQLDDGSPVPLPFEDVAGGGAGPDRLGRNSFGPTQMLRDLNVQEIPMPPGDIEVPEGIRRVYLTVRYYGCRPWFRHPYTGVQLSPSDLLTNVRCTNPEWQAAAGDRPLDELLQPDPGVGEPLVAIFDDGLIDENNPAAIQGWGDEANAENANAAEAVGNNNLTIAPTPIWHTPYYGLYCLRIRFCIPYVNTLPRTTWRYWIHWRYRLHQPWCWHTWWWHRWCRLGPSWRICAWRPLCIPHTYWTRQGPDWVWHVTSVNRWRYWCLYGLRYYCTRFGAPPFNINPVPLQQQMGLFLQPGGAVTPWLRPWPYPRWGYWPYRPYCTRWFWFRPTPWFTYRYLPPVLQYAVATPNADLGGGFRPGPDALAEVDRFPDDPPQIDVANELDPGAGAGSFLGDNFDIIGAATSRASVRPLGDRDGDGLTTLQDNPRNLIQERGFEINLDALDMVLPDEPQVGAQLAPPAEGGKRVKKRK